MKYWTPINITGSEVMKLALKRTDYGTNTNATIYASGSVYIGSLDKVNKKYVSNVGLKKEELEELLQIINQI